jgi:hypothetical protein
LLTLCLIVGQKIHKRLNSQIGKLTKSLANGVNMYNAAPLCQVSNLPKTIDFKDALQPDGTVFACIQSGTEVSVLQKVIRLVIFKMFRVIV